MPGLLRGVARTAVVAGTATAVSGRVQRRQADKYAERDAHAAAERSQAYEQEMGAQQPQYAAPPPSPSTRRRRSSSTPLPPSRSTRRNRPLRSPRRT